MAVWFISMHPLVSFEQLVEQLDEARSEPSSSLSNELHKMLKRCDTCRAEENIPHAVCFK